MKRKKLLSVAGLAFITVFGAGFRNDPFSVTALKNYEREFKSESIGACSTSSTKTYEDYRMITAPDSRQYKHIHEHMTVDDETGFLYDEDGFIGVALGYNFGEIGSRYYVVLDTGIIIPVVKVDAKAAVDASNGCSANNNASVIEFVIDSDKALEYFGGNNGYVNNGNFNNYEYLQGNIVDMERVLDERLEEGIVYEENSSEVPPVTNAADNTPLIRGGY